MTDDEQPAPDTQAQPDTGAPDTGASADTEVFTDFDTSSIPDDADREWLSRRYQDMQRDYSQKTMGLADQRREYDRAIGLIDALQDPATQADALRQLGYEVDDPEPPGHPQEFYDPRVDELLAAEQQRQHDAELDQIQQAVNHEIEQATSHLQLDEGGRDWIFDHAISLPPRRDGMPDVARAVKDFEQLVQQRVDHYVRSKRATPAPAGQPGQPAPDLNDKDARVRHMAAVIAARAEDG